VHAGAVSGVLATAQQVGTSLGVALIGMVFFSALGGGYARALEWSLLALIASTSGVALLATRLRPRRPARPEPSEPDAATAAAPAHAG
jgi:hypothetical protein